MTRRELEALLASCSARIVDGNHGELLDAFVPMMPVYFEGRALVIDGPEQLDELLGALGRRFRQSGIDRAAGQIVSSEDVSSGRFRVTVASRYFRGPVEYPRQTVITYYCTASPRCARVSMVEYVRAAFPDIAEWDRFNPGIGHETTGGPKPPVRH